MGVGRVQASYDRDVGNLARSLCRYKISDDLALWLRKVSEGRICALQRSLRRIENFAQDRPDESLIRLADMAGRELAQDRSHRPIRVPNPQPELRVVRCAPTPASAPRGVCRRVFGEPCAFAAGRRRNRLCRSRAATGPHRPWRPANTCAHSAAPASSAEDGQAERRTGGWCARPWSAGTHPQTSCRCPVRAQRGAGVALWEQQQKTHWMIQMLSHDIQSITYTLKHRLREDGQVRMLKKEA